MKVLPYVVLGGVAVVATAMMIAPAAASAPSPAPTVGGPAAEARAALPDSARSRVNPEGYTYGSAVDSERPGAEPDLIAVVATNGQRGYVWKTQLNEPGPANPQEASSWTQTRRTLPVYLSDGKTQIGEFDKGGR